MANETSGRRDNRVPFRASTKTPNIMMLRRTRLLLIVCGILAFAVLGIKLFSVMIIHHDEYEKMAIDQQVRETEITASRGAIYDTNGKILAMNASVDTIFISPAEIAKNNEDPQLIARELSEILDVDYDKILSMTKNTDRWYEVVKRKVEPDVSEKVRAFKKEKKLVGVKIEPDTKRYYPYGSLAAHVIGFVGQDNEGRYGLEQRYDSYLTGSTGRIIRATDNRGTDMLFVNYEDYYDETKGNDMNLTIDATIQYYLEKHLQQAVEDYDVQNGAAAIAMDPSTGAILGMVSLGNFDLNNYQKVSDKDQEAIDAETDPDKRSELLTAAQQKQWRNKALSDTYEPGSTFKIITLAMALEEGVVSESSSFYCGGSIPVLGRTDPVKCWKTAGHGSQTLTQAMQHSCNVALVQIGQLVGARTFYKYAEAFGFLNLTNNVDSSLTAKTGIDLSGDKMAMQRLKEAAEKAKIELSGMTQANVNLPFITADATGPKHFDMNITRAKFNELTADLVEKTMGPVNQALSDAGLSPSDLNKVLLVGGSTRIPAVQEAVKRITGKDPFKGINPDECVAIGAAIQGGVLAGEVKGLLLLDVTPLSLGLETLGGVSTKIIERNTTIPTKKSQIFTTAADNQTSVDIHVLQGEREMAKDNKTLGMFRLDGIAPAMRGTPQIEVTFDIDANGIVHVSAKDLGTGKEQHITITSSTSMSKEDIEKAVKDAEQFAEADKKQREEVDIRNGADQMIFQTEKTLKELDGKIDAADKGELETKLNALKEAVKGSNLDDIKAKQEDLQKKFYDVSAKLYQNVNPQAGQPGADAGAQPNNDDQNKDGFVDADFKEV